MYRYLLPGRVAKKEKSLLHDEQTNRAFFHAQMEKKKWMYDA